MACLREEEGVRVSLHGRGQDLTEFVLYESDYTAPKCALLLIHSRNKAPLKKK
jgi:hypothetical protein